LIGVSLSRWTMSYFATALLALIVAELLMAVGFGFPSATIESPKTLVLVHLVALGWLSLLMCGALFQFVPVLVARPLFSDFLPLPTLVLLVGGIVALLCGFLHLDSSIGSDLPLLPLAGALLGAGFSLVLWNLGRTLWAARPLPLPARFVAVGLSSLTAAAALGIVFTLALSGVASQSISNLTAFGLPVHVIAGLGGWLTFTAMGVSYRLLSMFMLAPEADKPTTRVALYTGAGAVAVAVIGGTTAICLGSGNIDFILLSAGVLGLAAVALYGADIVHLYRARKRHNIELNSRMAVFALVSLAADIAFTIVALAFGNLPGQIGPIVFLFAFGWLSGLGLAKLYKIAAFLTWLECYGPVLGKQPTPRVQDLVVERRASKYFYLYFMAVWAGTAALAIGVTPGFRGAAALMALATLGIVRELLRTRKLADVKPALRSPEGMHRPRLLICLQRT